MTPAERHYHALVTDYAGARSAVRKIIITTIVGVVTFSVTNFIFSSLSAQLAMTVGVGSVVLVIQFLADFEKRLLRLEAEQSRNASEIRQVVEQGFAKVNAATELFAQVEAIGLKPDAVTRLARRAAEMDRDAPRLVTAFAQAEIERVAELLRALRNLEVTYDGKDQDWMLWLAQNATSSIDAISIPDLDAGNTFYDFWESQVGRRYLDLQYQAIRRNVRVRRVFVTDRDELVKKRAFQKMCRAQLELGIEVRILYPSITPFSLRGLAFSFIVFDNTLSHELTPTARAAENEIPMILNSRLIARPTQVEDRITLYERIWSSARPPICSPSNP